MTMLCSNKGKNPNNLELDNGNNNIVMEDQRNIVISSESGATNSISTTALSLDYDCSATSLRLG